MMSMHMQIILFLIAAWIQSSSRPGALQRRLLLALSIIHRRRTVAFVCIFEFPCCKAMRPAEGDEGSLWSDRTLCRRETQRRKKQQRVAAKACAHLHPLISGEQKSNEVNVLPLQYSWSCRTFEQSSSRCRYINTLNLGPEPLGPKWRITRQMEMSWNQLLQRPSWTSCWNLSVHTQRWGKKQCSPDREWCHVYYLTAFQT